jgi:V-type H+-transporting ATPase subunit e
MAVNVIVFVIITAFWAMVGLVLPLLLPKGFNRGVVQTCLSLTAVCCYLM